MGLLACGRCGCTITAERKKGKYTYYRCTGFKGRCGNAYVREEILADLLGDVVERIEIPADVADWIAAGLRECQDDLEQSRQDSLARLTQRRRGVQAKLDRGYDDYLEGRISEDFWRRSRAGIGRGEDRRRGEPAVAPNASGRDDGREDFRTRENCLFPVFAAGSC
jgi:site-specific DNA recombinase